MSIRVVPSATFERICVSPRVNSAEPCTRGAMSTSHSIGTDLVLGAAVGALLVDRDPLADRVLLELGEGRSDLGLALGLASSPSPARTRLDDLLLDGVDRVLAGELLGTWVASSSFAPCEAADLLDQLASSTRGLDLELLLAGLLGQLLDRGDELLDLAVGDVERVEDLGLGDAVGAALDHQDRLLGAGDDQVHLEVVPVLLGGVDDEVAVELADRTAPTCSAPGLSEIASAAEAPFIARMS